MEVEAEETRLAAYLLIMAVLGPLAPRLADPLVHHLARQDAKRRPLITGRREICWPWIRAVGRSSG